jgi:hypothetical protein
MQPIYNSVPAGTTYEDIVGALMGRYADHWVAAANRINLRLKARHLGLTGEAQEIAATVEQ